jgi:hypothetical protein
METCARLQDELDITGAEESVDARGVDHDENKCRSRWDEMGGRMWSVDHLDGGRGGVSWIFVAFGRLATTGGRGRKEGQVRPRPRTAGNAINIVCIRGGGGGGEVSGETRRVRYL